MRWMDGTDQRRVPWVLTLVVACVAGCSLVECASSSRVPTTVKIGLTGPFEGRYRDLGYEALAAVRLAVRQRNELGGLDGRYLVEFVALNDFAEAGESMVQARKMAVDPGVLVVIGGWSTASALAAGPEFARLGLAFVAPPFDLTEAADGLALDEPQAQPGAEFAAGYKELSGGSEPGAAAVWTYEVAIRLLDAMDRAARTEGAPTRAGVGAVLGRD